MLTLFPAWYVPAVWKSAGTDIKDGEKVKLKSLEGPVSVVYCCEEIPSP